MELINLPSEEEVVKIALVDNLLQLIFDPNGTFIVQKVLGSIRECDRPEINQIILDNFLSLSYDNLGVCVLKKFISRNEDDKIKKSLLEKIKSSLLVLIQDTFGNYIIQHIIDIWSEEDLKEIIEIINYNICSLSMQKYSSNVIEKCFDKLSHGTRKRMEKELFNLSKLSSMLKNRFGSFCIQKCIKVLSPEEKEILREYLKKKLGNVSKQERSVISSLIESIH